MLNISMAFNLSYCGALVRRVDPDRFLLSMMMSSARREALWALFAFNHEIAKTREVVSEARLGMIRLQWWREAVATLYEEGAAVSDNEVLIALSKAIAGYDLPLAEFEALIYAREFDLEAVLPGNVEGLVNYADFTTTPLTQLVLAVLGEDVEGEPVQLVSVNYALAGLLRAVPFHVQSGACVLPEDLMAEHGQSVNKLYDGKRVDALPCVVEAVTGQIVSGVACESRFLKGMQALSVMYLKQIKARGYDVFHPRMVVAPPFKALRVLFSVM